MTWKDSEPVDSLPAPAHVQEWAERVGRTIAVHLEAKRYVMAHNALEAEIARAQEIWGAVTEMVAELSLPMRTVNTLESEGILSIDDLCAATNLRLIAIYSIHARTIRDIDRALAAIGRERVDAFRLNEFLRESAARSRVEARERQQANRPQADSIRSQSRRINKSFGDLHWLKPNRYSS